MSSLIKWEGYWSDGKPKAVLADNEGQFADTLQPVLRKLGIYEALEEQGILFSMTERESALVLKLVELTIIRNALAEDRAKLREKLRELERNSNQ